MMRQETNPSKRWEWWKERTKGRKTSSWLLDLCDWQNNSNRLNPLSERVEIRGEINQIDCWCSIEIVLRSWWHDSSYASSCYELMRETDNWINSVSSLLVVASSQREIFPMCVRWDFGSERIFGCRCCWLPHNNRVEGWVELVLAPLFLSV